MSFFEHKGLRTTILILLAVSIIINAFIGYYLYLDKRVTFAGEEVNTTTLLVSVFSIMIIMFLLAIAFFTNIGQQVIARFKNRLLYKSGKYVNCIYTSKSGVIDEVFVKVDKDGTFQINEKKYVRNPKLLYHFRNIPSYYIIEDNATPVDIFGSTDPLMNCGELDTVMSAETNFDLVKLIMAYAPFVLIILVIIVGSILATVFFNYQVWEGLRDGTAIATCLGG